MSNRTATGLQPNYNGAVPDILPASSYSPPYQSAAAAIRPASSVAFLAILVSIISSSPV